MDEKSVPGCDEVAVSHAKDQPEKFWTSVWILTAFVGVGTLMCLLCYFQYREDVENAYISELASQSPAHSYIINEYSRCLNRRFRTESMCLGSIVKAAEYHGFDEKTIRSVLSDYRQLKLDLRSK